MIEMNSIVYEEGEVLCPKCNGSCVGEWEQPAYSSCEKCWGSGKLDWIELATGKERPCAVSGRSSSSSRSSSTSSRQTNSRI